MPVKVLHLITRLDFGGAQSNTLYTVGHLNKELFEVSLAAGRGGKLDRSAEPGLIYADRLVRQISPLDDLLSVLELRSLIRKIRPAVVHTHSSKAGITGRLAAFLAGVPVIVHTFHGFGFHERQNPLKKSVFILLERLCAFFSDALIFVSRANMDYARGFAIGREEKYALIRSGIPLSSYPAFPRTDRARLSAKRRELGIPEDATVVVSIGNLKPQKNPGHFIEAARRLSAASGNPFFVFIGGGEGLEAARAAIKAEGLDGRLLLAGWRDDSAEILAASDVFAMTSLWEGLPKSLVEALKSGLPAVCYRADGVSDILRDGVNGWSVDPGDLDAFCAKLKELIEDTALRAKLAEGASATDLAEFDIDLMVRSQEKLYLDLLKRKTAS